MSLSRLPSSSLRLSAPRTHQNHEILESRFAATPTHLDEPERTSPPPRASEAAIECRVRMQIFVKTRTCATRCERSNECDAMFSNVSTRRDARGRVASDGVGEDAMERSSREALARAMRTRGKTREDGVRGRARRTKRGENILHEYFTRDSRARALGTSTISWMDEDRVAEGETAEMTRETDD